MAMVCRVCTHDALEVIDQALVSGAAVNALASRYGLSEAAVRRHKANHLPSALVAAQDAVVMSQANDLLSQIRGLIERSQSRYKIGEGLLARAVKQDDLKVAIAALREMTGVDREYRATLELLAELEGELDRRAQVNILVTPEFMQAASVLLAALSPYPEARLAAASALQRLEAVSVARN